MNKKITKKLILLIILIVLLLPAHAKAWSLFDFSENVGEIFLRINSVFISVLGKMLGWSVQMFTDIIKWQDFEDVAVVKTSWTIVRDFVNMFFILVLVIVSFGTIFGLEKYSITTPGLLSKIITAALLINFSLAIGGMIIDVSQVFSGVFLNSMGDFAGNLGAGLNLNKIFDIEAGGEFAALADSKDLSPDKFIGKSVIDSFFTLIIIGILLLSMLAAAIFSLIRIPILWGLLIISPAAWLLGILPFSQNLSKKWWDYFIGWTFFLPSYLFMMVIGTAILKSRTQIDPLFDKFKTDNSFASLGNFALQDIFFYIVAIMILTGSLAASLKVGRFASVGASGAFGKIKGGVERYTGVSAVRGGAKQVGERIKEEGVPRLKIGGWQPFKGARGEREKEARWAERFGRPFGLTGLGLAKQKEFQKNVQEELEKIKVSLANNRISESQIEGWSKEKSVRGMAAKRWLAQRGKADSVKVVQDVKDMGASSLLAKDYFEDMEKEGFSGLGQAGVKDLAMRKGAFKDFDKPEHIPHRLKAFDYMVEKRKDWLTDAEELKAGYELNLSRSKGDADKFFFNMGKERLDLVTEAEYLRDEGARIGADIKAGRRGPIDFTVGPDFDAVTTRLQTKLLDKVDKGKINDITDQNIEALRSPVFREALNRVFAVRPGARNDIRRVLRNNNAKLAQIP